MKLLLDTCTFLWVTAGSPKLSITARRSFQDFANEAYLSAVSAWKIALKHAIGTLSLDEEPHRFVPKYRALHGIDPLALSEDTVLHLGRLPDLHRDPFDRMLICQAMVEGMAILTPDQLIRQYPVRTIW
jgi:PIN domain nuclease of toxin-antitoxin system